MTEGHSDGERDVAADSWSKSAVASKEREFVVIGGGPAGLTAAYELTKLGFQPIVLEKAAIVGGLARTESYRGHHFDMGGHRFFTKSKEVERMWHDVLGADLLRRSRMSRIYYRNKFFHYPLKPFNALFGLGFVESARILVSALRWKVLPYRKEETFEQWVTNRFGKRLFEVFFKSYTEKVWGIPCSELRAEWAAQRIKNLSLKTALLSMIVKPRNKVRTLIDAFLYPRLGPGMLWNRVREIVVERGGSVRLESEIVAIHRTGHRIDGVTTACSGRTSLLCGTDFISSMPITEFINRLDPPPPPEILEAASKLKYRDFLTVCLIVNRPRLFADNWLYIHDPEVKVGRIQNFKNWSEEMVPNPAMTSLGLEYFCTEGDALWNSADADLIELGKRELEQIGLVHPNEIVDGHVFRMAKAYPIYDSEYRDYLETLKEYVGSLENFQTIGRNGLHRYNNQDHAMLTGILAVRNAVLRETHDLWSVNTDEEYHEEVRELGEKESAELIQATQVTIFAKLDRMAMGLSLGIVGAAILFLATLILVLKGGAVVGPNLGLLREYFPGYRVDTVGCLLGIVYGFGVGFAAGWCFALIHNVIVFLYFAIARSRAERNILRKLLDYI